MVDPDIVSPSNVGRQLFSPVDVGESKARLLVERINRFYGLDWLSYQRFYTIEMIEDDRPTFVVSCVDSVKARREIIGTYGAGKWSMRGGYWLDMGNSANTGQVMLGTTHSIKQPEGGCDQLPTIFDYFPNMEEQEDEDQPSCSMADALSKQDLFINSTIAGFGLDIIWRMFRYGRIEHHGCFVDLENYTTRPVSVENSHNFFTLKEAA